MKLSTEFRTALLQGDVRLENVKDAVGWAEIGSLVLYFNEGTCTLKYITADKVLLSSTEFAFNPSLDNKITLEMTPEFQSKVLISLKE